MVRAKAQAQNYAYDANGNIASKSDFNGNRTDYTYDLSRNLEIARTEGLTSTGATTPQTRTITTEWHPSLRLPTRITEPNQFTDLGYDAGGNLIEKKLISGTQTRIWTYTYNSHGQVLSADGPRTDVTDLTTYGHDTQGNLVSVTDALGHLIRSPPMTPMAGRWRSAIPTAA